MNILEQFLQKRGVDNVEDLSDTDKGVLKQYQNVFKKADTSVADIQKFCQQQIESIETRLDDVDNSPQKQDRLVILLSVYRKIISLIEAPKKEKERLEAYLTLMVQS